MQNGLIKSAKRPNSTFQMMSDDELALRISDGDERAFEEIVLRYKDALRIFIFNRLVIKDDTDDVLQEVYLRVWRFISKYRGDGRFRNWLLAIASNYCMDQNKRYLTNRFMSLEEFEATFPNSEKLQDTIANSADWNLNRSLLQEIIEFGFGCLSTRRKQLFILREVEKRDYKDISILLSRSPKALKTEAHRARAVFIKGVESMLKEKGLSS